MMTPRQWVRKKRRQRVCRQILAGIPPTIPTAYPDGTYDDPLLDGFYQAREKLGDDLTYKEFWYGSRKRPPWWDRDRRLDRKAARYTRRAQLRCKDPEHDHLH